jgi:type II secretory pathway pseudopilin PulG
MTPAGDAGVTFVEVVVTLTIFTTLAGLSAPLVANAIDEVRARHAAGFIASRFRLARQQAVTTSASVGVVFDHAGSTWTFRVCEDHNGNGIRRSEIDAGVDRCPEGPYRPETMFRGVRVAVDAALPGPDGDEGSADPVRFGASDIASFSPLGSCTAGSVYLRSAHGAQYLVRVAGVTGRTRILRYDPASSIWRDA